MPQLITTIISVLLVTLLTLAGIYWMGNMDKLSSNVASSTIENQTKQIEAASQLYAQDHNGTWPTNVSDLAPVYLGSIPSPSSSAFVSSVKGSVSSSSWVFDGTNKNVSLTGMTAEACKAINKTNGQSGGTDSNADGIPDTVGGMKGGFCYGKPVNGSLTGYTYVKLNVDGTYVEPNAPFAKPTGGTVVAEVLQNFNFNRWGGSGGCSGTGFSNSPDVSRVTRAQAFAAISAWMANDCGDSPTGPDTGGLITTNGGRQWQLNPVGDNFGGNNYCPAGTTQSGYNCLDVNTCPANSTNNGDGTCSCNSGYVTNNTGVITQCAPAGANASSKYMGFEKAIPKGWRTIGGSVMRQYNLEWWSGSGCSITWSGTDYDYKTIAQAEALALSKMSAAGCNYVSGAVGAESELLYYSNYGGGQKRLGPWNGGGAPICTSGVYDTSNTNFSGKCITARTCPANSTDNGGSCVCNTGYTAAGTNWAVGSSCVPN